MHACHAFVSTAQVAGNRGQGRSWVWAGAAAPAKRHLPGKDGFSPNSGPAEIQGITTSFASLNGSLFCFSI